MDHSTAWYEKHKDSTRFAIERKRKGMVIELKQVPCIIYDSSLKKFLIFKIFFKTPNW